MHHFLKFSKTIILSLTLGLFQSCLANEQIQNKFMDQAVQHNAWTALSSNSSNMQQTSNAKNSLLQHIKIPQPETDEKQAKIFDFGKVTPSPSHIRFSLNNNHPFYCSLDQLAPSCRGHSDPFLNGATFSGSLLFPSTKN